MKQIQATCLQLGPCPIYPTSTPSRGISHPRAPHSISLWPVCNIASHGGENCRVERWLRYTSTTVPDFQLLFKLLFFVYFFASNHLQGPTVQIGPNHKGTDRYTLVQNVIPHGTRAPVRLTTPRATPHNWPPMHHCDTPCAILDHLTSPSLTHRLLPLRTPSGQTPEGP